MKSIFRNPTCRLLLFLLVCTLWAGVFYVLQDFLDNPVDSFLTALSVFAYWCCVCIGIFLLLYVMVLNKYVFAVLFPVFCILGTVVGYYRHAYKATLTPMLIDATLHNDFQTSAELVTWALVLLVVFNMAISGLAVYFRFRHISVCRPWLQLPIAVVGLLVLLNSHDRLRNGIMQRYPFNVYYNVKQYKEMQHEIKLERFCPDTLSYSLPNDSLIVMLVLGESLRADHLAINGYSRPTTPFLQQEKHVYSFANIYSEYTHTNRSLPHILTRADSIHEERAFEESSFITLFKNAGFATTWISNQDPAYTYIYFLNECDTIIYTHPERTVYVYSEWLDEDMLPALDALLPDMAQPNLIILHTIGSHWFYNNHVSDPWRRFLPVAKDRVITQNTPEEIINAYDNTVVYTDFFLKQLMDRLKDKHAILLYLSDHGEALGEEGNWLHASDCHALKHPACLIWCSDEYARRNEAKIKALEANRHRFYRTDFLYHSILSAGHIPTPLLVPELDVFTPACP